LSYVVQPKDRIIVNNAPRARNRNMAPPVDTPQQKALKAWIKIRAKRTAAVASKPPKHGKKST
jgi:hypothetical protein